nr:protein PAT1 homolog 1 [Leptinotarsa decemlineata]
MQANAAMLHRNLPNQIHNLQQQYNHQQRTRHDSGGYRQQHRESQEPRDEYAGLMTLREKQWLLNIQLLQLNTGTPYFDDYYYTIFKERKSRSNKENLNERNLFNNKRQHRNSDRQENQNTLTPRVYTPLQFENSLGKLQCGSVTAPRKIIDMDIVTPDKDNDTPQGSRDTRKTKQLLLELEAHYASLLKAEDINNPLYISNMEKLREMKQKQRLKELEVAPTPEQKQEILRLFKLESEPIVENQYDYIVKIIHGLLQDEKFNSFFNIRKGKMLVLRLLPHLAVDVFSSQLLELWSRVLLSLPIVGRRDTAGDNILPKFYPFFKRFVQTCSISDILDIVTGLVEVVRQENNRSTPLSHVGKSPLYFILMNKFGTSALVILLIRVEYLITTDSVSEKQQNNWFNYLTSWAQQTEAVSKLATPIELIPSQIFIKHCNRFNHLKPDKKLLLEKHFVDSDV